MSQLCTSAGSVLLRTLFKKELPFWLRRVWLADSLQLLTASAFNGRYALFGTAPTINLAKQPYKGLDICAQSEASLENNACSGVPH